MKGTGKGNYTHPFEKEIRDDAKRLNEIYDKLLEGDDDNRPKKEKTIY